MNKNQSSKMGKLKVLIALPAICLVMSACSKHVYPIDRKVSTQFPAIELKKMYAWRSYNENKLVNYGYYVFTQLEDGQYSGVQINSYWDTNWNVTAIASKDTFLIKTPQPWNESWKGINFDGKTIHGKVFLSGGEGGFELDIVETNKNDSLIQKHVKP